MSNKRYSDEETKMICEMSAAGKTDVEIVAIVKEKFSTDRKESSINRHIKNNASKYLVDTASIAPVEPLEKTA